MEIASKHTTSPSSSANILVSPETLSHHSSPAKSSRILYQSHKQHSHHAELVEHQQVTIIDERTSTTTPPPGSGKMPLSVSAHHQLVAAISSPIGPQPSISDMSALQLQIHQPVSSNPATSTSTHTGHLALLYHSSSHHHHLHPVLPITRRPSRLPPAPVYRPPEIKAYVYNPFTVR